MVRYFSSRPHKFFEGKSFFGKVTQPSILEVFEQHNSIVDDEEIEVWLAEREKLQAEADEALAQAAEEAADDMYDQFDEQDLREADSWEARKTRSEEYDSEEERRGSFSIAGRSAGGTRASKMRRHAAPPLPAEDLCRPHDAGKIRPMPNYAPKKGACNRPVSAAVALCAVCAAYWGHSPTCSHSRHGALLIASPAQQAG